MGNVTLEKFRTFMNSLGLALTAQADREVVALGNPIRGMGAYKVREFLRMYHPKFSVSKVEEDPNGFIYEVYKTLAIMGLTSRVKAEIFTCQWNDIA